MKKQIKLILLGLLFFLFLSCGEQIIIKDVRGPALEKMNLEGTKDSILIIDTRVHRKYIMGHVPHAINIPRDEIQNRVHEISDWSEKVIYVYDEHNDKSFESAKILVRNGYGNVLNAEGITQYNYKTVKYNSVPGAIFSKLVKEPDVVIIDCRSKSLYAREHIKNAISIPLTDLESSLDKLQKDKKILLYCNFGTASARAAKILSDNGYTDVYSSIDGMREYNFDSVVK